MALAVFRAAADNLWPNSPLAAVRHLLPPIPVPGPEVIARRTFAKAVTGSLKNPQALIPDDLARVRRVMRSECAVPFRCSLRKV